MDVGRGARQYPAFSNQPWTLSMSPVPPDTWATPRGFTLTEVMIVIVLAGVVTLGLVTFYLNSQAWWTEASTQVLAQRDATLLKPMFACGWASTRASPWRPAAGTSAWPCIAPPRSHASTSGRFSGPAERLE